MTPRKSIYLAAVSSTAFTLLLAACGDDDDSSDGGAAATELTVKATEFAFDPTSATVAGGSELTITLVNEGTIAHEWAVLDEGVEIGSESEFEEALVMFEIEQIAAGTETSAPLTLDPGNYQVICAIPGHFDAGMTQALTAS